MHPEAGEDLVFCNVSRMEYKSTTLSLDSTNIISCCSGRNKRRGNE